MRVMACVALFLGGCAAASSGLEMELTPTIHCMGVRIRDVGDRIAGAKLHYRPVGGDWQEALPLVVCVGNRYADEPPPDGIRKGKESLETAAAWQDAAPAIRRLHGSIFWLTPGTTYEIRATLVDPDGVARENLTGAATTLPDAVTYGRGRTLRVGSGMQYAKIVDALRDAGPGDTVVVAPGTYAQSVWMDRWPSGQPGNPITIRAEKGVVLDGDAVGPPPGKDEPGYSPGNDVHAGFNVKDAHDLVIEGFEIRRFNYRMFIDRCERIVVQRNLIDCLADPEWKKGYGIRMKSCRDCLVQHNVAREPARGEAHYTRYPYSFDNGRRMIIRYNRMLGGGCHDIITTRGNSDTDIYENDFRGATSDDGVELEGGTCVNLRFFNNYLDCRDGTKGTISTTPTIVGPVYVVRNVFVCSAQVVKFANDGTDHALKAGHALMDFAPLFFYHNVFYNPKDKFFRFIGFHGRPIFVNNITCGKVIPDVSENLKADRTTRLYARVEADHNVCWDGGATTKSHTPGLDEHSVFADPAFVDAARDDFRLREGSPAVDRATPLPNVNDRFAGRAPDIGCFERDSAWTGRTLERALPEDPR